MQDGLDSGCSTLSRARAWMVVLVLLLLVTVALLDRQAITLMVDAIKMSYGISDAQMGLLQGSAFAIPFLIGTISAGWVLDRFDSTDGRRIVLSARGMTTLTSGTSGTYRSHWRSSAALGIPWVRICG
jgi:hypothetical protein